MAYELDRINGDGIEEELEYTRSRRRREAIDRAKFINDSLIEYCDESGVVNSDVSLVIHTGRLPIVEVENAKQE